MRHTVLLLPLLLTLPVRACFNDRDSDTLANQANAFPETVRVITGRFNRNPPLFYQMRIQREQQELQKDPRQLRLYDDIAVAYSRIHQDADGLKAIERKRALLPPFNAQNPQLKEDWYRYYANAGTLHVHHWLGQGAKVASIAEMKLARRYIQRAIEIKPNAHFGRERYQVMTMDWIMANRSRKGGVGESLVNGCRQKDKWGSDAPGLSRMRSATQGLSGLIVLGAAWESPDVFEALAASLDRSDGVTLRQLALLRCDELLKAGKKSFAPSLVNADFIDNATLFSNSAEYGVGVNAHNQAALRELFPTLRTEAEEWMKQRDSYALGRLKKGDHPDADPHFWADWHPTAAPNLDVPWWNDQQTRYINRSPLTQIRPAQTLIMIFGALAAALLLRSQRARRRAA